MREIKFRAWNNKEKVMSTLRGFDFLMEQAIVNYPNEKFKSEISSWNYKDKEIELMQFTGLQDKNGVDIYEGDIFHLGDKKIKYTVVWHDTGFKGEAIRATDFVGLEAWKDQIEVIGNIYENPELLEV